MEYSICAISLPLGKRDIEMKNKEDAVARFATASARSAHPPSKRYSETVVGVFILAQTDSVYRLRGRKWET